MKYKYIIAAGIGGLVLGYLIGAQSSAPHHFVFIFAAAFFIYLFFTQQRVEGRTTTIAERVKTPWLVRSHAERRRFKILVVILALIWAGIVAGLHRLIVIGYFDMDVRMEIMLVVLFFQLILVTVAVMYFDRADRQNI